MKLSKILDSIVTTDYNLFEDIEIKDVTSDTRMVTESCLFVCIKGENFDGHNAAHEMIKKGAAVIVCEKDLGIKNQIIVNNSRKVYAHICANFFGRPDKRLKLIGVTGTNGKTTVTTILKEILSKFGYKVGLIGTRQNEIGDQYFHTDRTTPEPYDLFKLFKKMADENCDYVVMETSSQALAQYRTGPAHFEIGIFTNLTQDHLDFHKTMENYYLAKKMLFDNSDFAVVNVDDEWGKRYYNEIECEKASYSLNGKGVYNCTDIDLSAKGSNFTFCCYNNKYEMFFPMPGLFNVANITAVIGCCDRLGLDLGRVSDIIKYSAGVRGRLEVFKTDTDFIVICDYAHTDDALENVLGTIKKFAKSRIITVFGAAGNRDAVKRPMMGKAVAKYSDYIIVTADNPRDEDVEDIFKQIEPGFLGYSVPYFSIPDREKAVVHALQEAKKDDIVILCGKGHEDYQVYKGERFVHFSEKEVVEKWLTERNK